MDAQLKSLPVVNGTLYERRMHIGTKNVKVDYFSDTDI